MSIECCGSRSCIADWSGRSGGGADSHWKGAWREGSGAKAPDGRGRRGVRGPGKHGRRGPNRDFARDLNLTDAQRTQIRAIHDKYRPRSEAVEKQLKTQADAVRALRQKGDTAGARAASQRLRTEAQQRIQPIREQEQAEIRNLLTARQRAKFDAAKQRAKSEWRTEGGTVAADRTPAGSAKLSERGAGSPLRRPFHIGVETRLLVREMYTLRLEVAGWRAVSSFSPLRLGDCAEPALARVKFVHRVAEIDGGEVRTSVS